MITSNETVQAKIAFKRYPEERGVYIHHYHADNGRFADKGFIDNCQLNNQCLTYSGVNTHFQNGMPRKEYGICKKQQELPYSSDRIPSTTPGAEPPRDAKDSGSARSHSTHLETNSSNRP